MNASAILFISLLSLLIFLCPKRWLWYFMYLLQLGVAFITSFAAVKIIMSVNLVMDEPFVSLLGNSIHLVTDKLSAFFIIVINITALSSGLYAKGYLKPYFKSKNQMEMALHMIAFFGLHLSMLLVVMIRDGLAFLIVWEMMAVSSFILIIFESEKKETVKIGLSYLIQMHIALVFIMTAFIIAAVQTGSPLGFDYLSQYFSQYPPLPLFVLFFIGFGIKAGFIPLHSWLPHAHPAAPSHVSAIMSSVILKMGIYGILRVITHIETDLFSIGIFVLTVSILSGLLGVMYAIVQHDVKKLLAYHSIENIGIIGIGIGLGLIGLAKDIPALAFLGFSGGILHVLNHSLFKSLLFFSAGSVYQQTHTRVIDNLGGLIKSMPKTAFFFLLGALAICGLPPFNGFISEFLIYSGLFHGLQGGDLGSDMIILVGFSSLTLIGGLAIFCFTKVFSVVFLGSHRSEAVQDAREVTFSMILAKSIPGILILAIGLLPAIVFLPLSSITFVFTQSEAPLIGTFEAMKQISLASLGFFIVVGVLLLVRRIQQKKTRIAAGPTWGCGYTGANPAKHQYTATSYAYNYGELVKPLVKIDKHYRPIEEKEIFPQPRSFSSHPTDVFEENLINKPINTLIKSMGSGAVFQTGKLQHYVLYALVFLVAIFFLTVFNVI